MVLSIIVPIYNAENYLSECIDSLLDQKGVDLDIVLVNDGSKDSSSVICEKYHKEYNNIQYISIKNGGVSNARNIGIEMAIGDWICFVDADDHLLPNCIEKVLPHLEDNVSVLCCNYMMNNIEKDYKETVKDISSQEAVTYLFDYMGNKDEISKYMTAQHMLFTPCWGKFYRREYLLENGLRFPVELKLSEDLFFNYAAFSKANKIRLFDYPIYGYNINANSVTHQVRESHFTNRILLIEKLDKVVDDNKETRTSVNRYILTSLLGLNYQVCLHKNKNKCKQMLIEALRKKTIEEIIGNNNNWPTSDGKYQKIYYRLVLNMWKRKAYTIGVAVGKIYNNLKN